MMVKQTVDLQYFSNKNIVNSYLQLKVRNYV